MRNQEIDVAKGIGIIAVVLGHLVEYGGIISKVIFVFHMPLFFFLSGYLLSEKTDIKTWKHKILPLIFSFVEFSFLGFLISVCIPSWREELSLLVLGHHWGWSLQPECLHVGQIWYLAVLAISVTFFMIIKKVIKEREIVLLMVGFLSFLMSVIIGNYVRIDLLGRSLRVPFKFDTALAALFFLILGFLAKKYELFIRLKKLDKKARALILFLNSLIVFLIAVVNLEVNLCDAHFNNPVLYIVGAISGIIIVLLLSIFIVEHWKIRGLLAFYGKNSLPVFATHSFLLYLYAYVLSIFAEERIMIMDNVTIPAAVLGTVIILVCEIPVPWMYEKTFGKFNKWLIGLCTNGNKS